MIIHIYICIYNKHTSIYVYIFICRERDVHSNCLEGLGVQNFPETTLGKNWAFEHGHEMIRFFESNFLKVSPLSAIMLSVLIGYEINPLNKV